MTSEQNYEGGANYATPIELTASHPTQTAKSEADTPPPTDKRDSLIPFAGYIYKSVDNNFSITAEEMHNACRFEVIGDKMAPQLPNKTVVLAIEKQPEEWDTVGGLVVLTPDKSPGSEGYMGRLAEVTEEGFRLNHDNPAYPTRFIKRDSIKALYHVVWITYKELVQPWGQRWSSPDFKSGLSST